MAKEVIMPKFGFTQETAELVRWLKHAGDPVEQGEPIAEVTTDKVNMEVEAPADGVLAGVRVQEGEEVPVTTVIALILAPGEAPPANAAAPAPPARATPVARRVAAETGLDLGNIPAANASGRITRADVERYAAAQAGPPAPGPDGGKVRATPAARRLAREHGFDLARATGSGPRGRVQGADVQQAALDDGRRPTTDREFPAAVSGQPLADVPDTVIPLTNMRRAIAQRMQNSYQTAPHITLSAEIDMSAALAVRQQLNRRAEAAGEPQVSMTGLLVKVCAWALRRHPRLNASWQEDGIHLHGAVNVGVAVALEDGLIVPVVRAADRLGLGEISRQVADLAERARENRLRPDDVSGGTFTVSNLGMYGIDDFTAIINPPESAILAVGRIAKRQVVVEEPEGDEAVIRPVLRVTLSADHRVVDGAVAALFMADLRAALEQPAMLLL